LPNNKYLHIHKKPQKRVDNQLLRIYIKGNQNTKRRESIMGLKTTATAKLLAATINQRIESTDITDPQFTAAVDRMKDGCSKDLGWLIICKAESNSFIELPLVVWSDKDCRIVFGKSRNEILDMCD
jgi:hypothetical protein